MRVYEFAKKLDKDAGDLLEELNGNFGFDIKSHLSGISKEQMDAVKIAYSLNDDLTAQVDDSHKQDLKETFNDTIDLSDEWTLGSGDDIVPPENKLDEEGIKKLKKENEKAVQSSMKSAKESREKYATTLTNIVENPDSWHVGGDTPKIVLNEPKQQEVIVEKPSWLSRMLAWWIGS